MLKSWNGDKIVKKVRRASKMAVNETMRECVLQAKRNHPGWKYRSGTAEGSVRIVTFAHRKGKGIAGEWGSLGTDYVLKLELHYGSFLRNAAAVQYPELGNRIKMYMKALS